MSKQVKADNGWLYVTNNVVAPPASLEATLAYLGCGKFWEAIKAADITGFLESLSGITLFAPTDAAFTAGEAAFNAYTLDQKRAVILHHFVASQMYSISMNGGNQNSLLGNNPVSIVVGNDALTIGNGGHTVLSDNFVIPGVIHRIDKLLTPPNLPAPGVSVTATNIPGTATWFTGPGAKPTGSNGNPNSGSNNNTTKNSASSLEWTLGSAILGLLQFLQ